MDYQVFIYRTRKREASMAEGTTGPTFCFNAKVVGRTAMATELQKDEYAEDIGDAGLVPEDLRVVAEQGRLAEEYDRKQRADLATKKEAQSAKVKKR